MNFRTLGLAITLGLFSLWGSLSFASDINDRKPDLLLLKTYQLNQPVKGWVMSEKLDGVRAYWNGKALLSRNGNVFAAPAWFTEGFPPFELDGELWLKRAAFSETVSIVKQSQAHEGWRNLTYQIFEVPNQPEDLLSRLAVLQNYLDKKPNRFIKIIKQTAIDSKQQIKAELNRVMALGGEGLVLRDPNALYHAGRSASDLKLKPKEDAECRVIGYTNGLGKYQGQVGALICDIVDGQFTHLTHAHERVIKIGSGLSDAERRKPPEKGQIVTFQYMGETQKGLPRFPVFLRVRDEGL
ncbi:MAG: DNA ligase [Thiotrichales bacterium]|nr:DNA ligase [Thiotrichales bacterium]